MSTAPLFKSFVNLSDDQKRNFDVANHVNYDFACITNFILSKLKSNDSNEIVHASNLVRSFIFTIENYERENKENTSPNMENN